MENGGQARASIARLGARGPYRVRVRGAARCAEPRFSSRCKGREMSRTTHRHACRVAPQCQSTARRTTSPSPCHYVFASSHDAYNVGQWLLITKLSSSSRLRLVFVLLRPSSSPFVPYDFPLAIPIPLRLDVLTAHLVAIPLLVDACGRSANVLNKEREDLLAVRLVVLGVRRRTGPRLGAAAAARSYSVLLKSVGDCC